MLDTQAPAAPPASPGRMNVGVFLILMVGSILASIAILPYAAILTGQDPQTALTWPSVFSSVIGNLIITAPLAAIGL